MTELELLRKIQEIVEEIMIGAEDSKDDTGSVFVETELLERLWEQNREYNEFMGPGGVQ